jgi:transcriptional regulator with XRE-family HTH domain
MTVMTVSEALRTLRQRMEKSQQRFATELNLSLRAYQKYEVGEQLPDPRPLLRFLAVAEKAGWEDLARVFRHAMLADLDQSLEQRDGVFTTADRFESLGVGMLLYAFRAKQPEARVLAKKIAALVRRVYGSGEADRWIHEAIQHGFLADESLRSDEK